MKILGLDWVGTRTSHFRETVEFFEHTLGLPVGARREEFVRLDLPNGSCVEVFGPGEPDHVYFTTGPVVGFLVEDIEAARHDLVRHRVELLGETRGKVGAGRWQHFRAPDGYVYEIDENPDRHPGGSPTGPLGITHLAWVGTRTTQYEATLDFFGRVLGLEVAEDLPELTEYRLPDGAGVEVFLPGTVMDHPHFSTGPVPGFGVSDLDVAVEELRTRNVRLLGLKLGETSGWAHFRASDGCVYEVKGPRHP
jgi:catechol 2,3-dioxygenase-like lactoylglutathione lyase family enzyme